MNSLQWLAQTTNDDTTNSVATRSGVTGSTLSRQVAKGTLSPETVVAIARAYHAPVLPGLVACGLITADEARVIAPMGTLLTDATDEALLDEVLRRIRAGHDQHPTLTQPLDHVPEPADEWQDDYDRAAAQYEGTVEDDNQSLEDWGA